MSLSIKRLVSKTKLPYPIFFAILCSSTYFFGVFLALLTDNLYNFFSEYGFILLCLFGYASGVFTIMLLNSLEASINEVRNYVVLKEEEWRSFRRKILEKATSRIYWLVFFFWIVYSFHHIFFTKMSWWKTSYNSQFIIDLYGFIVQGINGCFLGGIFMTLVSINLNLAYREIYSNNVFSTDIASSRGKRKLSKFKKLVVMETFAAAIVSALAISIWSKAILYTPVIGSMIMILPTAVYPHYIFYKILSKAKEDKLDTLEENIKKIPSREATIGDLIQLNKLSLEIEKTKEVKPWLIDIKAVFQLLGAAVTSQTITLIIDIVTK